MTRKELLELEARNSDEFLEGVHSVILIPSTRKSETGFGQLDMVAGFKDSEDLVRFGGKCDLVNLVGSGFVLDSDPKTKLVRVYNPNTFSVSADAEVMSFIEKPEE